MLQVSKSDFMLFLKHPAWAWIKKHKKELIPEVDENTQSIFDAGNQFEKIAEQLMPHGKHLGFSGYDEYLDLIEDTKQALADGNEIIFQGRFEANIEDSELPQDTSLTCIVDVLHKVGDKKVEIYEIKSSTRAKSEHKYDLAFQKLVLEMCGYQVVTAAVMHVDNSYVRSGDIEPNKIVATTDITGEVNKIGTTVKQLVYEMLQVLSHPEIPDISPRHTKMGGLEEYLKIYKILKKAEKKPIKKYSIYNFSFLGAQKIGELEDEGIFELKNIPESFSLTRKQRQQAASITKGKAIIESEPIKNFLTTFEWPLYFLDYETTGGLLPNYDGVRPYQQLPFQYSLHKLESPDAELEHFEYLHQDKVDPTEPLVKKLIADVGDTGSVIVWNQMFEKGVNKKAAELHQDFKNDLLALNERIIDLMIPFQRLWYMHPDFFGSSSIKNVLPALVKELSYKDLQVNDGQAAQRVWQDAIFTDKYNKSQTQKVFDDLLQYCKLDTQAMVEIYQVLENINV